MTMTPETCDVGFKEWAGVCDALATGRQAIILRKGGIDEASGPGLFVPEHSAFWLYPTRLHQAAQGLREAPPPGPPPADLPPGTVPIRAFAVAHSAGRVEDERTLDELRDFHVWTDETVHQRFQYRSPGLWVLATRIYTREPPYYVAATPEHEGCKTWVPLDRPLSTAGMRAALDEETWWSVKLELQSVLKRP